MIIQHLANLPSSCPADSSSIESCVSALKSSISILESSVKATGDSAGCWEVFSWLCAIAVGVGIAGEILVICSEYRDDLQCWSSGIIRSPDKPPKWRFWFDILATFIVLGGVFGEAGASAKISSINSQLRSKTSELGAMSDQLLGVMTQVAGDAAVSANLAQREADAAKSDAKSAHDESNAVDKKSKEIADRVSKASAQLTLLEQTVRFQGPRWRLLEEHQDEFISALKPFAGQRVAVAECGSTPPPEVFRLAQRIYTFLRDDLHPSAGWKATFTPWAECTNGMLGYGVVIIRSSKADRQVLDSALALANILSKIQISNIATDFSPDWLPQILPKIGEDSPPVLAMKDPTSILVVVGPNLMTELEVKPKK